MSCSFFFVIDQFLSGGFSLRYTGGYSDWKTPGGCRRLKLPKRCNNISKDEGMFRIVSNINNVGSLFKTDFFLISILVQIISRKTIDRTSKWHFQIQIQIVFLLQGCALIFCIWQPIVNCPILQLQWTFTSNFPQCHEFGGLQFSSSFISFVCLIVLFINANLIPYIDSTNVKTALKSYKYVFKKFLEKHCKHWFLF